LKSPEGGTSSSSREKGRGKKKKKTPGVTYGGTKKKGVTPSGSMGDFTELCARRVRPGAGWVQNSRGVHNGGNGVNWGKAELRKAEVVA